MSYVRQPTEDERQELKRMTRRAIGRTSQRAQMVLLSSQGRTCPEIAKIFEINDASVRFWLRRFDVEGPNGLYDEPRSGRPRKATAAVAEVIESVISQDPNQEGHVATLWTVRLRRMLTLAIFTKLGLQLAASTMRFCMQDMGLRWGRPRLAMPRKVDPQKAQKQWQIAKTVIEAGPEAAVLYADESRVQLLPLIRAMWHWVGQQIRVPTPGKNDWRALFGALNIRTGQWTYIVRPKMHKEDFIAFLEHLLIVYPTQTIVLIVDNYSSHTAGLVKDWLVEHERLQLLYLPTYCSHLNPVEQIWLQLKGKIAADRLSVSMQVLLDAVSRFFTDMSPEKALVWAAA